MPVSRQELEFRQLFMPIAVFEHHFAVEPTLDVCDICNQLGKLWEEVQSEAQNNEFDLEVNTILVLNHRVAASLNAKLGSFRDVEKWLSIVVSRQSTLWSSYLQDLCHKDRSHLMKPSRVRSNNQIE